MRCAAVVLATIAACTQVAPSEPTRPRAIPVRRLPPPVTIAIPQPPTAPRLVDFTVVVVSKYADCSAQPHLLQVIIDDKSRTTVTVPPCEITIPSDPAFPSAAIPLGFGEHQIVISEPATGVMHRQEFTLRGKEAPDGELPTTIYVTASEHALIFGERKVDDPTFIYAD